MKTINNQLFVFWMCIISFASCANETSSDSKNKQGNTRNITEEYYYNLPFRESPYQKFSGVLPSTKEQAKKRNHYRFTYDSSGRLIELSFMRKNNLVAHTTSNNFFMGISKIKISYKNSTETLTYFNFKNEQIDFGNVWTAVYSYDKSGHRKSLHYLDDKGMPVENYWNISKYEWETDAQGRIKEQRFNLKGAQAMLRPRFDFYEVRLTFDSRKYLIQMDNYGKNGKLVNNSLGVATDKLVYDTHGNFKQWKVYDVKGNAVIGNLPRTAGGNHFYNNFGEQIKTELFDLEGDIMTGRFGWAYSINGFDAYGGRSFMKRYNADNDLLPSKENGYWIGSKSNERNQMKELAYYNKDGKLIIENRQGIARATYTFDNEYNMIERAYFDDKGKLTRNKMRGFAIEKYLRDYKTGSIDTLRLDANLKVINRKH